MRSSHLIRLALLAFVVCLVAACDSDDEPAAEGETPYGVGLYDLNDRTFRSIPLDHPVSRVDWLDNETFVAFDTDDREWTVYDLNGAELYTVRTTVDGDGGNQTEVYPGPDGEHIIVQHNRDPLLVVDVTTGVETPYALGGIEGHLAPPQFSPDGRLVALTATQGDRTAVVLAEADGSNAREIRVETDPDREWWIGRVAWSSDNEWLKVSVTFCPRGSDPECHSATGYATHIIDLNGNVIWETPESPDLDFPGWAGPSRIFVVKAEREFPEGPTFKFIALPDLSESDAPMFFSYRTNVSPNGEFALDGSLEDCVMRDARSGNEVVEGGCGLESWSRDGTRALIHDVACSPPLSDDHVCLAGRYLGRATPTPESEEDSREDVYVPGDICSADGGHRDGLTPSSKTPIADPDPEILTPALAESLRRFAGATFHITYSACIEVEAEMRLIEVSWYKDEERSRYDILEIVDGRKQFLVSYIVSGDDMVVCSDRLGPYLHALFVDFEIGPEAFGDAVEELSNHERACMSDPHRALFFFTPLQEFGFDPFSEAGVADALPDDEGDVSVRGAWEEAGTKEIAGVEGTCFEAPYQSSRALCFSDEGMLLYASESSSLEAVSVEASVSDSDFEPYHDLKAKIGRCFPRIDEPTEQIDVDKAIRDGDIEDALTSALLTLEDLDCSWSDPLPDTDDPETESDCSEFCCTGPSRDAIDFIEAQADFAVVQSYRDLDPYEVNHLRQSVRLYAGDGAMRFMEQVRDYWSVCAEHTFESERGDLITVRASEILTAYGDESVAYLLTHNHAAYGDYVIQYVRKGELVTVLAYYDGALGIRDPERARAAGPADVLMGIAEQKLEAVAAHFD